LHSISARPFARGLRGAFAGPCGRRSAVRRLMAMETQGGRQRNVSRDAAPRPDTHAVKSSLLALIVSFGFASHAAAQDPTEVRRLFEAGQYAQVVEAAGPEADPAVVYTAAQSQQKLGADEPARELYRQLAERPD